MRAQRIVFTGPGQAALQDVDVDDSPMAAHEVLLRTACSVISPGTELAGYAGDQTLFPGPNSYPVYPGYAAVGEVLAAGEAASVRQGDLVLAHTPHQSLTRFDSRERVCVRVPDGVAPEWATLARIAQVSAVSIRLTTARPGDQAAVIGLGLVGNLAAQLARCAGLQRTRCRAGGGAQAAGGALWRGRDARSEPAGQWTAPRIATMWHWSARARIAGCCPRWSWRRCTARSF